MSKPRSLPDKFLSTNGQKNDKQKSQATSKPSISKQNNMHKSNG